MVSICQAENLLRIQDDGLPRLHGQVLFPLLLSRQADLHVAERHVGELVDQLVRELDGLVGLSQALLKPAGYQAAWNSAEKKGYSGVGVYTRRQPDQVIVGLGIKDIDAEGRYIEAVFGKLSVVSVYLPSGSSGEHRQAAKFKFMKRFYPHLAKLAESGREVILCGDWNIAHREIDLKNWKSNQKNSGFLPEERAWLTRVFDDLGWVDVYRRLCPDATGEAYTWWSNRGQAYANNVGWRIDYQIATPGIAVMRRASPSAIATNATK